MSDQPRSPEEWAALLRTNWEARGRSDSRDFYVASHPGWNDRQAWEHQARVDTQLFLHGLNDAWLADAHVLEVGCGVGRLAGPLGERCASYTGVDIAEPMVAEARQRHAGDASLRFLVGDGLGLPAEAADRRYRLAVAVAVFIHCPPDVIAPLARSAYELLEPGGELRFQLRADPDDPEGLEAAPPAPPEASVPHAAASEPSAAAPGPSAAAPPATPAAAGAEPPTASQGSDNQARHQEQVAAMEATATPADMSLIDDRYYMGHAFGYAEARRFLADATGGEVEVLRFDPTHLYGWVKRV